jgi:hypothetical protein
LQELCNTLIGHIGRLEFELEKNKAPHNVSTIDDETFKLRAELKELKEAVFVDVTGTNACGDGPVGLMQVYWDTGNRTVIGWDAIHKLAAEQTPNVEDDGAKRGVVTAVVNATSVKEDNHNTSSKAKSAKLAKLVKLAKSTALWCLLPYIPLTQEAKDKQRKVCLVNLRGEVCTASKCGSKHPKVCFVADHGKRKIPKATCSLWHMRVPFTATQGNFTGRRSRPKPPLGGKGNNCSNAKPAKPDKYLAKLEAEYRTEEPKARIRAQKMMSQGFTYSQVVEGPAVPPRRAPAHVAPRGVDPAPAPPPAHVPRILRTALTPDEAIAIFEDTIERLRLPQQQ